MLGEGIFRVPVHVVSRGLVRVLIRALDRALDEVTFHVVSPVLLPVASRGLVRLSYGGALYGVADAPFRPDV